MSAPELSRYGSEGEGQGRNYVHPHSGVSVPSVTTVLRMAAKDGLPQWASGLALKWAYDNIDLARDRDSADFVGAGKYQWTKVRDERAFIGTEIHEYIEADLRDAWDLPQPWDPEVLEMVAEWRKFRAQHVIDPHFIEATAWSHTYGYAGTFDWLGVLDGVLTLADNKGLPLDTPLPTPTGWTTMGAVEVGDELFGSDGKPYHVLEKSAIHHNPCYRITFDTGESVVADVDHKWVVRRGDSKNLTDVVMTTEQLRGAIFGTNGQRDLRVMNAAPLDLPAAKLPLDPYVLGVWLGDGTKTKNEITINSTTKTGIIPEIERRGWPVRVVKYPSDGETEGVRIALGSAGWFGKGGISPFLRELRALGLSPSKRIPGTYMRASFDQRLDLLRGLMDTDGGWNIGRSNEAVLVTTDPDFRDDISELVSSLGMRAQCAEADATWTHKGVKKVKRAYRLTFRPGRFSPFLAREYPLVPQSSGAKSQRRLVVAVDPVETVPTQCITMDSPDETYLFGRSMMVTHNSSRSLWPEHEMQLAALACADVIMVKGADGTWSELPMPKVDGYAFIHVRPRYSDPINGKYEEPFCRVEYLNPEDVGDRFEQFVGYLQAWNAEQAVKTRRKARDK